MEAPEAAVAAGGEYPESAGEEEAYPCKGCGEVSLFDCLLGALGWLVLTWMVDSGRGEGF